MTNKICTCCGEAKPIEEYHSDKRKLDGKYSVCKSCHYEMNWRSSLKGKYGITENQYNTMLERQHYGCRICGEQCSSGRRLAVDHCHSTGQVRGLLCGNCNRAIGLFDDDVNRLNLAAQYLTASGEWLNGTAA